MSEVLRISLPGYNALTDTNPDHFALRSDYNWVLIKEKARGTVSIATGASLTIAHGLSYVPFVFVFAQIATNVWVLLTGDSSDYDAGIEVNSTNIIIHNNLGATASFKYYIFYDELVSGTPANFISSRTRIAVSKSGVNALTSTNPNDFIFHSDLNTFKIIKEGVLSFSFTAATGIQEFLFAHGLTYAPLVQGFVKFNSGPEVLSPNQEWVSVIDNNIRFNSIVADQTYIKFRITNNSFAPGTFHAKYYAFEVPLA